MAAARHRLSVAAAAGLAAAAAWCAPAQADTLTVFGNTAVYAGDAAQPASLWVNHVSGGSYEFEDRLGTIDVIPASCTRTSTWVTCPPGISRITLNLGDRDDYVLASDVQATLTVNAGDGGDEVIGGTQPDLINGGPGGDELVGDNLDGAVSHDTLDGGGGDDLLRGGEGRDELRGGPGNDGVDYLDWRAASQPLTLTLDGVANDGAAGESDNLQPDIENLRGRDGPDVITGDGEANTLVGGGGNDVLTGGGGYDIFEGERGDDAIHARDGLAEEIGCGQETDSAEADASDFVSSCESVATSIALMADADEDGLDDPLDCDDGNPGIRPGATDTPDNGVDEDCAAGDAIDFDRDEDGFPRPIDCDDGNAAMRPGGVDVRGNAIDEDCFEGPAPYLRVKAVIANRWAIYPDFTRVRALAVRRTGGPAQVIVSCRGGGCPFKRRTWSVDKALDLRAPFRKRDLKPGTEVEIRVLRDGMVGKVVRYRMRDGKVPASTALCVPPGGKAAKC